MQEGKRGKEVGAEMTCLHIDSGCCISCLSFLWPNYCLVSGRKGLSCVSAGENALFEHSLQVQVNSHDLDFQKTEVVWY
jgi:hypothetical protein